MMQNVRIDNSHSVSMAHHTLKTRRLPAVLNSAVVALPSDRETAKLKGDLLYCMVYFGDPCKLPAGASLSQCILPHHACMCRAR